MSNSWEGALWAYIYFLLFTCQIQIKSKKKQQASCWYNVYSDDNELLTLHSVNLPLHLLCHNLPYK